MCCVGSHQSKSGLPEGPSGSVFQSYTSVVQSSHMSELAGTRRAMLGLSGFHQNPDLAQCPAAGPSRSRQITRLSVLGPQFPGPSCRLGGSTAAPSDLASYDDPGLRGPQLLSAQARVIVYVTFLASKHQSAMLALCDNYHFDCSLVLILLVAMERTTILIYT